MWVGYFAPHMVSSNKTVTNDCIGKGSHRVMLRFVFHGNPFCGAADQLQYSGLL